MQARRASRELAFILFSQFDKTITNYSKENLDDIIVKSVRILSSSASDDLKTSLGALIDMKNNAEQLILAIDKTLSESGDKLTAEDKETLEKANKEAKDKLATADSVEEVKNITEELSKATNPIFTKLYQQAQAENGGNAGGNSGAGEDGTININPDDIN